jgi:hypothetical protein
VSTIATVARVHSSRTRENAEPNDGPAIALTARVSVLIDLAQRAMDLRRLTRALSGKVALGTLSQAPYLLSGGFASFAAALALSRLNLVFGRTATKRPVTDASDPNAAERTVNTGLAPTSTSVSGIRWFGAADGASRNTATIVDCLALPDGRPLLILCDVSGDGLRVDPSRVRQALCALAQEGCPVTRLIPALAASLTTGMNKPVSVVGALALVDTERRTVICTRAGRAAGVVVGSWGAHPLPVGAPSPDAEAHAAPCTDTFAFGDGDLVVFVSDGLADVMDVPPALLPFVVAEDVQRAPSADPRDVCLHLLNVSRPRRGAGEDVPGNGVRAALVFCRAAGT